MNGKLFLPVFLVGLTLLGCQQKSFTPENLPALQLQFGEGGGFTGAITTYTLLENGQLFRHTSLDNVHTQIGQLKKQQAKSMLTEAISLKLNTQQLEQPGNMYYFIRLKTDDSAGNYTWGDPDFAVNPEIKALYKKLADLVQKTDAPTK